MTLDETTQVLLDVARLIGAGVVGGLIGSYATHRFTLRRERDKARNDRAREFRSFVAGFKSAAAERHFRNDMGLAESFAGFYLDTKWELRHAAFKVANDFVGNDRKEFDRLVNDAAGFNGPQADDEGGKERIVAALDEIVKFLDDAA
jgi:hypothetical protein